MARAAAVLPAAESPERVMTSPGLIQQGQVGHQKRGRHLIRQRK